MNKREYNKFGKLNTRSWHCPCCNPYGCSVRKMKRKARRFVRRKEKQNLSLEF